MTYVHVYIEQIKSLLMYLQMINTEKTTKPLGQRSLSSQAKLEWHDICDANLDSAIHNNTTYHDLVCTRTAIQH